MAKYLFVYHGGTHPSAPAEMKSVMDAWGSWFGSMGRPLSMAATRSAHPAR